jgi:alpha/beta superfamily hydrolase
MPAASLHNASPDEGALLDSAPAQPDRPNVTSAQLPEAGKALELLIPGPAGAIETLIAAPRAPARGFAVICHPHPLFGGAMSNKVTYALAATALRADLYALRFNFRGVGRSEGVHDRGRGETEDVIALVLAGFSFGGFVSLRAAERARPTLQISVAPPFGERYVGAFARPAHPGCPWLVVHSRDDDTVSYDDTVSVLRSFEPPPELATLDGAGHFFHGRLPELQDIASRFLGRHWPGA